jgi:hypothetical protein
MDEELRKEQYEKCCKALAFLVDLNETAKIAAKQNRITEDGRNYFGADSIMPKLLGMLARLPLQVANLSQAIQLTLEPHQGDWVTDPVETPDVELTFISW